MTVFASVIAPPAGQRRDAAHRNPEVVIFAFVSSERPAQKPDTHPVSGVRSSSKKTHQRCRVLRILWS